MPAYREDVYKRQESNDDKVITDDGYTQTDDHKIDPAGIPLDKGAVCHALNDKCHNHSTHNPGNNGPNQTLHGKGHEEIRHKGRNCHGYTV